MSHQHLAGSAMHEGTEMASEEGYHHVQVKQVWVSICKVCFRTAAQAEQERELAEAEKRHECSGSISERPLPTRVA